MKSPAVIFDLGNVILLFDYRRMTKKLSQAYGLDEETIHQTLIEPKRHPPLEIGQIQPAEFIRESVGHALRQQPGGNRMRMRWTMNLVFLLFLSGCFAKIKTLPNTAGAPVFEPIEHRADAPLVGLAVSGGGSRAATFAAGALEALAGVVTSENQRKTSLLEKVTHISSVSGGSLASAYYAAKKPPKNVPVLDDTGLSPSYKAFFASYKEDMQLDFQRRAFWRQVFHARAFNPTKAAYSFAEVWDADFFNRATFADLYAREKNGDSPRLILNGTQYNNGRRFALTTLPAGEFNYDFTQWLEGDTPDAQRSIRAELKRAKKSLTPMTMESIHGDHRTLPLSLAVATSASFPPVVGPVTYRVEDEVDYHHIGDGGLFDNLGLESLVTLFLNKIPQRGTHKGLILVIDAAYPFDAGEAELNENKKGFQVFGKDPSRIVGIMEERARAYQSLFWDVLREKHILLPESDHFKIIILSHTDYDWKGGYSDLPAACHATFKPDVTPETIRQRVQTIPTLFKVDPCHGALLIMAAHKSVEQHQEEVVEFLNPRAP